jgi:transcriptional regulator with XRE-family HTH domain
MSFAPRIEEIMRARGMSQVALAHALGITSQAVSNWLNNANGVVGKRLPKIAAALCVEITDLVAAVGSPIPPLLSGEELAKTVIHPGPIAFEYKVTYIDSGRAVLKHRDRP